MAIIWVLGPLGSPAHGTLKLKMKVRLAPFTGALEMQLPRTPSLLAQRNTFVSLNPGLESLPHRPMKVLHRKAYAPKPVPQRQALNPKSQTRRVFVLLGLETEIDSAGWWWLEQAERISLGFRDGCWGCNVDL